MKIVLNDVTEEVVDRLEDAFNTVVGVYTNIWEGTASDTYRYEIEVDAEDPKIVNNRDFTLEDVAIIYKNSYYMLEIVNASQYSTVDIKYNEVGSVVIV